MLGKGDCFFEPAGQTVLKFDNASADDPAEIFCFYLSGNDETPLIEMLDGGMDTQLGRDHPDKDGADRKHG